VVIGNGLPCVQGFRSVLLVAAHPSDRSSHHTATQIRQSQVICGATAQRILDVLGTAKLPGNGQLVTLIYVFAWLNAGISVQWPYSTLPHRFLEELPGESSHSQMPQNFANSPEL